MHIRISATQNTHHLIQSYGMNFAPHGIHRTRKAACSSCRNRRVKCEQRLGSPFRNWCTDKGLVCTGPVPTEARVEKERKKFSQNVDRFRHITGEYSAIEALYAADFRNLSLVQALQPAAPMSATQLMHVEPSSAPQTSNTFDDLASDAMCSVLQDSSQIPNFTQVPAHDASPLEFFFS